jgi:hypothetical protein
MAHRGQDNEVTAMPAIGIPDPLPLGAASMSITQRTQSIIQNARIEAHFGLSITS